MITGYTLWGSDKPVFRLLAAGGNRLNQNKGGCTKGGPGHGSGGGKGKGTGRKG